MANESTTVWVCTECGREHAKHAPPCSRCGNATLERQEITIDESELSTPGYRDLLTPRYVLGFAVALGLAAVLLLGIAGVIDLPGMDDSGVPEVEDVPGSADTYEGTSLAEVETAFIDRYNQARSDAGAVELERDDGLDDVARYVNQQFVKATEESDDVESDDQMGELVAERCETGADLQPVALTDPEPGATAQALGVALAEERIDRYGVSDSTTDGRTGVDVHAGPDGTLYAVQITC